MTYLKNWSVWHLGKQLPGAVEYSPPALALRAASFQAGAMDAPQVVDDGMEPLTLSLRLRGLQGEVFSVGLNTRVTVREGYVGGVGIEDVIEGRVTRIEHDARQSLSRAESSTAVTITATFYKRSVDGRETVLLIPAQGIRRIGGVDVLSVVSLMVLISSTGDNENFDVLDFVSEAF